MKTYLLTLVFVFCLAVSFAQTLNQTILIDFGRNDVTNGNITANPDANGNFWTNVLTNAATGSTALINKTNAATGFNIVTQVAFSTNGGASSGGLMTPSAALLGNFAIATATEDFFFTTGAAISSFQITGLNPARGYVFTIFGSRENTATRTTRYTVSGFNAATGTLQTSGTAIGASGYDGNNNTKFQSNVVYPNASGIITLEVKSENATFGYINAMQMEEFSGLQTQDILVDFGPNDGTNGNITSSPDANGNHWNNVTGSSAGNITAGIVNNTNTATGFSITTVSAFGTNGIVHGGLLAPSAALLGNLAINTATQDYFFTGGTADIKFTGLNPSNGYVFTAFGSRSLSTATRISNYSFAGLNTSSGTLQTTGNNIGSDGIYDGNDNNVYKSAVVYPTAGGEITFTVSSSPVTIAYINAMKITEYNFQVPVIAPPPPPPPSVPISMWSIVAAFVLICTVILMRSFKLSV